MVLFEISHAGNGQIHSENHDATNAPLVVWWGVGEIGIVVTTKPVCSRL